MLCEHHIRYKVAYCTVAVRRQCEIAFLEEDWTRPSLKTNFFLGASSFSLLASSSVTSQKKNETPIFTVSPVTIFILFIFIARRQPPRTNSRLNLTKHSLCQWQPLALHPHRHSGLEAPNGGSRFAPESQVGVFVSEKYMILTTEGLGHPPFSGTAGRDVVRCDIVTTAVD